MMSECVKVSPEGTNHDKVETETKIFDNQEKTSPWMTAKQAAQYLCFKSASQIYNAVFKGQLKPARIGKRLRFHKDKLDQWLLSQS
jgi:excisionase family DNA binding protein